MRSIVAFFYTLLFSTVFFSESIGQLHWNRYAGNPVLRPGSPAEWDSVCVVVASVVQFNDTLHMWYDGNHYSVYRGGIGHAWSLDGKIWIKDTLNNPVLPPGPWDWNEYAVTFASVLFNPADSLFHMWYSGRGNRLEYHPYYVGHATSPDGSHWTKDSIPALGPGAYGSWDDDALINPEAAFVNDTLHLWYNGSKFGSVYSKLGHAVSTDWYSWQKDPENPVLTPGKQQDWDYPWLRAVRIYHDGLRFNMFYAGGIDHEYDIGYAYSDDGTNWIKYPDPVLTRGVADTWEDGSVFTGSVLMNAGGDSLRMWYSGMKDESHPLRSLRIGYATAAVSYEAIFEYTQEESFTYKFTDLSVGIITSRLWDFGDGDTSAVKNPVHTYDSEGTYEITLTVSGPFGSDSTSLTIIVTHLEEKEDHSIRKYNLYQNYPNPFNPTSNIEFSIPKSEFVTLKVYNILGEEVTTLVSERLTAGRYKYDWNASSLASGVYLYRIQAGEFQQVNKMVLVR